MSKIRIERNTGWIGQLARIEIYIDSEKVGTINTIETQEYEVENGKHKIHAKFGWDNSQKIELNIVKNEIIVLKLTQYKYGTLILLMAFGLQLLYMLGKDTLNFDLKYYYILSAILILHPVYYWIKKKSLVLKEIDKKTF
ncbi:hypothetical protein MHL31_15595 [Lutibacter sp. A80]|uniref:hypothetical protein n=1 Tax=Lutibacter sp. A80 TaxID=2918453 RepID=UPI001F05B566|nr:hypothetical protein [Lutibacter sp. A80]UMB60492.1 hypothetical protein MHL31_15595 [Lutibacter sp. A80]